MPFKIDSIYIYIYIYINCPGLNVTRRCITYIYIYIYIYICGYCHPIKACYGYVSVCVCMHFCVLMRMPSCNNLLYWHLFISHVLIIHMCVFEQMVSDFFNHMLSAAPSEIMMPSVIIGASMWDAIFLETVRYIHTGSWMIWHTKISSSLEPRMCFKWTELVWYYPQEL